VGHWGQALTINRVHYGLSRWGCGFGENGVELHPLQEVQCSRFQDASDDVLCAPFQVECLGIDVPEQVLRKAEAG
jgi:hypothetical protein